jgi:4-amino-4-deoxy-L-arabinose transferase-like glycosyltransferase
MAPITTAPAPDGTSAKLRRHRIEVAALCVLAAGFIAIRLWNLTAFCLDSDEIFSLLTARDGLTHLFQSVRADVVHPPLSYLLLWLWVKIGGQSMPWLRLLPFLLSILALVPAWIVFRQLRLNAPARVIALALLAINDYQVFHARYVRMYALLFLLSLASMALYYLLLEGATRKRVVALTAVNLLLVYTQYFGWMVIGIEGLHLLWMDRRKLKAFVLSTAVSALLFAPWAYVATQAAIAKGGLAPNLGWIRHPKIGDVWWYYVGCDGPLWPIPVASAMVFFLFGAMLAGLWRVFRAARDPLQTSRLCFAALLAFLPPFATYLLSNMLRNSIWGNRHLIVSAVPYLALLATGLVALRPKWARFIVISIAAAWGVFGLYRVTMYPELRNNMDVLTGQLVEMNARSGPGAGPATVDFLDPYLAFPMSFYLESHYHQQWNLANVSSVDQITGDRVWVGYNHKSWKQSRSPEDLLRERGYEIGPGAWAGDRWDRIAVFLACRGARTSACRVDTRLDTSYATSLGRFRID